MPPISTATQIIAYELAKEYQDKAIFQEAAESILKYHPDVDIDLLCAMWCAIDAYVERMGQ